MITGKPMKLAILVLMIMFLPLKAFCQDEMFIGLIPDYNIFEQVKRHKPLAAYLTKKLGVKVRLTILSRYGDIINRFESGRMDGAFFGILTGYLAMEKLGVEPIATAVSLDGKSTTQSYIFVRKDSGIKTVKDMQGKRIAFVDNLTMTGFLYAVSYLKENGVHNPETYFRDYSFTGSHDSVIYSVLDNRADIGCVKASIYKKMIEKDSSINNELSVISISKEFPSGTLSVRKSMPSQMKSRLKTVLLHMKEDEEGKEVLNRLGALNFEDAKKRDLSIVRDLIRRSGNTFKDRQSLENR